MDAILSGLRISAPRRSPRAGKTPENDLVSADHPRDQAWWGELRLREGQSARWRIGSLELAARRGRQEWLLAFDWDPARPETEDWQLELDAELSDELADHERFVVGETGDRLALRPLLADRPVVSLPRLPVQLLPEREATLYVGTPIWVRVEAGEPAVTLRELPSRRASDTWFGGSTREGELCYATQTRARLQAENLPVLSHSAVTAVRIRNEAASPLSVERLKLPVPLLSLYCDQRRRLWTEAVTLIRSEEESEMASLDIGDGPPPEAAGAELLTPPRSGSEPTLWIRAFSSLFGIGRREE